MQRSQTMIIWLASYPRSGNTYYRMLLNQIYGIKTYSIYNDPLFEEIGASSLVGHELLPLPIDELSKDQGIYFVKTHDLPIDNSPAIYLVRDGRDSLISFANYIQSFGKNIGRFDKLKNIFNFNKVNRTLNELIISNRYGGWSNHVISWTRLRKSGDTFAIRYEDLVADPIVWLKKSLDAFQIQIKSVDGKVPNFNELHKKWPKFFRKGKIGAWQEDMPKELHELFWMHHYEAMDAFGYYRT